MAGIFKINNVEVIGSDGSFSGTIGNAIFPSGHIIQTKTASFSTQTSHANNDWGNIL